VRPSEAEGFAHAHPGPHDEQIDGVVETSHARLLEEQERLVARVPDPGNCRTLPTPEQIP
jgi:hypothetical protein